MFRFTMIVAAVLFVVMPVKAETQLQITVEPNSYKLAFDCSKEVPDLLVPTKDNWKGEKCRKMSTLRIVGISRDASIDEIEAALKERGFKSANHKYFHAFSREYLGAMDRIVVALGAVWSSKQFDHVLGGMMWTDGIGKFHCNLYALETRKKFSNNIRFLVVE